MRKKTRKWRVPSRAKSRLAGFAERTERTPIPPPLLITNGPSLWTTRIALFAVNDSDGAIAVDDSDSDVDALFFDTEASFLRTARARQNLLRPANPRLCLRNIATPKTPKMTTSSRFSGSAADDDDDDGDDLFASFAHKPSSSQDNMVDLSQDNSKKSAKGGGRGGKKSISSRLDINNVGLGGLSGDSDSDSDDGWMSSRNRKPAAKKKPVAKKKSAAGGGAAAKKKRGRPKQSSWEEGSDYASDDSFVVRSCSDQELEEIPSGSDEEESCGDWSDTDESDSSEEDDSEDDSDGEWGAAKKKKPEGPGIQTE